jgi:hypothetical protein
MSMYVPERTKRKLEAVLNEIEEARREGRDDSALMTRAIAIGREVAPVRGLTDADHVWIIESVLQHRDYSSIEDEED